MSRVVALAAPVMAFAGLASLFVRVHWLPLRCISDIGGVARRWRVRLACAVFTREVGPMAREGVKRVRWLVTAWQRARATPSPGNKLAYA